MQEVALKLNNNTNHIGVKNLIKNTIFSIIASDIFHGSIKQGYLFYQSNVIVGVNRHFSLILRRMVQYAPPHTIWVKTLLLLPSKKVSCNDISGSNWLFLFYSY